MDRETYPLNDAMRKYCPENSSLLDLIQHQFLSEKATASYLASRHPDGECSALRELMSQFTGWDGLGLRCRPVQSSGLLPRRVSVSKLAEKQAAPEKVPVIRLSLAILFVAWLISLFAGATAMTVGYLLVAAVMVFGWFYNWTKYSSEYAEWDKKFICLRCSNVFEVAPRQDAVVMEQSQAA